MELAGMFGKHFNWIEENFEQALLDWTNDQNMLAYKALPTIVYWGILIHRNKSIFKDKTTTPQLIASNILAIANHFTSVQKPPRTRDPGQELIDKIVPWGYFDRATQGEPTVCGARSVLHLN